MLVLDIETSGTDPQRHGILAIGAVDLTHPFNTFYGECRLWEEAHIMEEALAVNGFSREALFDASKPSEGSLLQAFFRWSETLADRTLAAHNVAFDAAFLQAACRRVGIAYPFAHRTIDVHSVVFTHMQLAGYKPPFDPTHRHSALSLTAVRAYVGLPPEPTPHHALEGACGHAEVLSRIWHGTSLLPQFARCPVPPHCVR